MESILQTVMDFYQRYLPSDFSYYLKVGLMIYALLVVFGFVRIDFSWIARYLFKGSESGKQLTRLDEEIHSIRQTMSGYSQIHDFAKYFRLDRTLKHHLEEREKLAKNLKGNVLINSIWAQILTRLSAGTIFLWGFWNNVTDVTVFDINAKTFYPFNFLLQTPRNTFYQLFTGTYFAPEAMVHVSLLNVIVLGTIVLKVWQTINTSMKNNVKSKRH